MPCLTISVFPPIQPRPSPKQDLLARTIENWQARKSVRSLLALDDHLLRDFGTCRCEVEWAAHLPLSVNAVLALDERARISGRC